MILGGVGFAALWVVFYHLRSYFDEAGADVIIRSLAYYGYLGVDLFFVLSGFTMAIGYNNQFKDLNKSDLKNFYVKRLIRIYPLYILNRV